MIVPHDQLRPETLTALIEEFVTRDGTVQGHTDIPIAEQMAAVRRQLEAGLAVVVFDEGSESCSVLPREEAEQHAQESQRRIEYDGTEPRED